MIWACPLCQQSLVDTDSGVACDSNHRFDRARQGYLNLLPAHHKRSQAPGDDRQMLMQRREFLQQGYYQPLAEALQQRGVEFVAPRSAVNLLDTGCGEGYYLARLMSVLDDAGAEASGYGSDISKEAARLAAAEYKSLQFAVASSFQLPVQSASVDLLLRVFAPGDSAEVIRVLKPGGQFWRVVPGADHLRQLKEELYDSVRPHQLPDCPEGMRQIDELHLKYSLELNGAKQVAALLQMTPFVWRGNRQGRERLQALTQLAVDAEFVVQCYDIE